MTTPRTRELGFETIKVVARSVMEGDPFLSYSDLSSRLNMKNQTGQGLGPILDYAAELCAKHDLPDVTANVVSKSSLENGEPMPSEDSFNADGYWPLTGLHRSEVPDMQRRVISFDWKSVRPLNL